MKVSEIVFRDTRKVQRIVWTLIENTPVLYIQSATGAVFVELVHKGRYPDTDWPVNWERHYSACTLKRRYLLLYSAVLYIRSFFSLAKSGLIQLVLYMYNIYKILRYDMIPLRLSLFSTVMSTIKTQCFEVDETIRYVLILPVWKRIVLSNGGQSTKTNRMKKLQDLCARWRTPKTHWRASTRFPDLRWHGLGRRGVTF